MANRQSRRKNKADIKRDHERIIDSVDGFDGDYKRVILTVGIIIIIFCAFYFLTVYVLGRDSSSSSKQTVTDSSISYTETMAGRSFSMPEDEYLILYYDRSDSELLSTFSSTVSTYRSGEDSLALYSVDMSNAMNKDFEKETSNWKPTSVSELAIHGPTLIHFRNGEVVEYFEGATDVVNYLS